MRQGGEGAARRGLAPALALAALLALLPDATRAADAPNAALAPERTLEHIAFGSCSFQERPVPIFDTIAAAAPDVLVMLGDNVYADYDPLTSFASDYRTLAAQPAFARLRTTVPLLATWDDHDYGANDAGADYAAKEAAREAFFDFVGEPERSPRRERPGIYDAHVFGPEGRRVQVILLDTRWNRSPLRIGPKEERPWHGRLGAYLPATDPATTILGEEQWRWLAGELAKPAELRLVVSSIQVLPEDHRWERWANFPHERARLLRTIAESGARGVVFLSGDRHHAELSLLPAWGAVDPLSGERTENPVGYPLYEVTASSFNAPRPFTNDVNRHRLGTVYWGANFGVVEVDWERPDPRVSLDVRQEDGSVALRHELSLSDLAPATTPALDAPRAAPG